MSHELNTVKNNEPLANFPKIWDFSHAVPFLRSYYEFKKSVDKNFSYGTWALQIGIKSRSFLRLVLVGKRRLTNDVAELISDKLELNPLERKYFLALVQIENSDQIAEKVIHNSSLQQIRKKYALKNHDFSEIQKQDLYDYFSSYQMPRLQVLLTLDGIDKSATNLAKLLQTKESEIVSRLETLNKLGFAKCENKQWVATKKDLQTQDHPGDLALQSFHKKSLEEAITAISLPKDQRRFQSLVLSLNENDFKAVHQELRGCLEQIVLKYADRNNRDQSNDPLKIYQINLNLIPVSSSILQENIPAPVASADLSETNTGDSP